MSCEVLFAISHEQPSRKPWILIAAYDVTIGETSEGHVAFNILRQLCKFYRIVLVTRCNNKLRLKRDPIFAFECSSIQLVGYDLPKWVSWWKRGGRFYQAYAYLWQMTWPKAVYKHKRLLQNLHAVHVLNFHNDSIPSSAWKLGIPVIWGPINHNEIVDPWRREFWPVGTSIKHLLVFLLRRVLWQIDPFLRVHIQKCQVILSAGDWVDKRLKISRGQNVIRRSQLGVSAKDFQVDLKAEHFPPHNNVELICAGRLDWIKGIDLAIEALCFLPAEFHLRIVGNGPGESQLRDLAAKLGVDTRVIFQGSVPRQNLWKLYSQADLFLFTSAEVAGLAWIEALASGLPVVAFCGLTEIAAAAAHLPGIHLVNSENTRRANIQSLAASITNALSKPYDPTMLRARALEMYGWDRLVVTIREAYCASMGVQP